MIPILHTGAHGSSDEVRSWGGMVMGHARVSLVLVTTAIVGPIESKPIYHFRPGLRLLSLGFAGCNLGCTFCQNHRISQDTEAPGRHLSPTQVIGMARDNQVGGVAFCYSEPLVHPEQVQGIAREAREARLATVLKTNGFFEDEVFCPLVALMDAVNVDVKGPRDLYREACGIDLPQDPSQWQVIRNIRRAAALCHVECSMVIIPGFYDDPMEMRTLFAAIRDAGGCRMPLHLLSFVPDFRMSRWPPTPWEDMLRIKAWASDFFEYVYADFAGVDAMTTCPCGQDLVVRRGLVVENNLVNVNKCPRCDKRHNFN